MAPDADFPIADSEAETPPSKRRGIALCLSGCGFRATLFHLGAIQRLFELGIATRPDFDTVPQGEASRSPPSAAAVSRPHNGLSRKRDCFDRRRPMAVSQ